MNTSDAKRSVSATGPRRTPLRKNDPLIVGARNAKAAAARKAEEAAIRERTARERAALEEAARQHEEESSQYSNGSTNGYYNANGVYHNMASWGFGGKRKVSRTTKRVRNNRRRSTRRR